MSINNTNNTINNNQQSINSGFEAKSEPTQVLQGIDLSGKNAIVTGGYSGIGLETVAALTKAGATVTVPARRTDVAIEALDGIIPAEQIQAMDLSDLDSVTAFAESYTDAGHTLDLLINNAGIMACPETRTKQGWEMQFATNHLGHFALFQSLVPSLVKSPASRVVALSSIAHRMSPIRFDDLHFTNDSYDKWMAYGQAKTANALFARGVQARYHDKGLKAFSVHPGGIFTPLQRHLPQEEMTALGWLDENGEIPPRVAAIFKSPSQGCTTSLWAATSQQLEGYGGQYCEDCDIANPMPEEKVADRPMGMVRSWACDDKAADQLWELSVKLTS